MRSATLVLVLVSGCASLPRPTPRVVTLDVPGPCVGLPAFSEPPLAACREVYERVAPLIEAARLDEARAELASARELAPRCAIVDLLEARIARRGGDPFTAFGALDRAAMAAGADLVRADRIATSLLEEGERGADHALMFCDGLPGDDAASRTGCAVAALRLGDRARAEAWLREAIAIEPRSFAAWMDLGEMWTDVRSYDQARVAFTAATRIDPDRYEAFLALGAAERGAQHFDAAEASYRIAIEIDPDRAEAYYDLGLLYQDYGDDAEPTLRQAQDFYRQFAQHAQGAFTALVDDVSRRCPMVPHERASPTCRPGRIQLIETYDPTRRIVEMQAQIHAMQ